MKQNVTKQVFQQNGKKRRKIENSKVGKWTNFRGDQSLKCISFLLAFLHTHAHTNAQSHTDLQTPLHIEFPLVESKIILNISFRLQHLKSNSSEVHKEVGQRDPNTSCERHVFWTGNEKSLKVANIMTWTWNLKRILWVIRKVG